MADGEDDEYNTTHKAFLQAFLARSTLTLDDARPILAAIFGAKERTDYLVGDVTEPDFNSYVNALNAKISPFDLEIRSTYHQTSRQRIYALVNSTSDPITQLATIHSADEISYVKRLLDAMFDTVNTKKREIMAVDSMHAMKLAKGDRRETRDGPETQGSSGQGLTLKDAEKLLKSLVEEGWFAKSRKGYYSLAPRALMELRGWLVETYNDEEEGIVKVKQCSACTEIITVGQRCHDRDCSGRLHDICTQRFFNMTKARKCPVCKEEWTGKDFVGERAAVGNAEEATQRRSTNGSSVRPQSLTVIEDDTGSDDESGEGT